MGISADAIRFKIGLSQEGQPYAVTEVCFGPEQETLFPVRVLSSANVQDRFFQHVILWIDPVIRFFAELRSVEELICDASLGVPEFASKTHWTLADMASIGIQNIVLDIESTYAIFRIELTSLIRSMTLRVSFLGDDKEAKFCDCKNRYVTRGEWAEGLYSALIKAVRMQNLLKPE
jgi:hypothetical protein